MSCDCSRLAYGALLMQPLECKPILGPFNRSLVLTDVVFDLYNHPNGDASKACGFVWNTLPNQWSRLLVGGMVDDRGRQYSFESGVLCPQGSYISICSCLFVSQPTALFSARVMGCFCEKEHKPPIEPGPFPTVAWVDGLPSDALDPRDPTGQAEAHGRPASLLVREVLATSRNTVEPGELLVRSGDRALVVRPGDAVALRVTADRWQWSSEGARDRTGRAPKGTSLIAARRSPDGLLVHWALYRESSIPEADSARSRSRGDTVS
jgi:hypothetical protein